MMGIDVGRNRARGNRALSRGTSRRGGGKTIDTPGQVRLVRSEEPPVYSDDCGAAWHRELYAACSVVLGDPVELPGSLNRLLASPVAPGAGV